MTGLNSIFEALVLQKGTKVKEAVTERLELTIDLIHKHS